MTEDRSPRTRATLIGCGLIVALLVLLAVAPSLFRRTSFVLSGGPAAQRGTFPLESALGVLRQAGPETHAEPTTSLALKALMQDAPGGLLVNFWATWCPPCVEELPSLEALHRQLQSSGNKSLPKLVAISVDESPADVVNFFKTLDYTTSFPVLYDREGSLSQSVGTVRFPETYWIGPDGTILHKWVGPQDWVSAEILQVLRAKTGS